MSLKMTGEEYIRLKHEFENAKRSAINQSY
mgnify:CR=1 FL=1